MKNRTGIPVRGADYFQRETLISKAGYINNQEQAETYTYNSPLLQMWWRQNVAH